MRKIIFFTFALFATTLFAQEINVSGRIIDDTGLPANYVNVTFDGIGELEEFQDTMTDDNGDFSITLKAGKYMMVIQPLTGSLIEREENFTQNTNLGTIRITSSIQLGQTVAVGEKPIYRLELDKRVYDMSRDATVKGASLSDALNNVPSVQVDSEGTLSLRGSESVRVLIDGKPSAMTGISNVAEALRNIQADQVERVEVITNPSARYEAEGTGGIINIILKKGSSQGFNASFSANLGYQEQAGFNSSLNYKTKKWNFFVNPFIQYRESEGKRSYENYRYYPSSVDTIEYQNAKPLRKSFVYGGSLGFEHYLDDKNTLSVSGNIRNREMDNSTDTYSQVFAGNSNVNESVRSLVEDGTDFSVEGILGFKHEFNNSGHQFDLQATGSWSEEKTFSDISDIVSVGVGRNVFENNDTKEMRRRWMVKGDYVYPSEEHGTFEFGGKIDLMTDINDFTVNNLINNQWLLNTGLTDKVDYTQNIYALYSQYGKRIGRMSFLAGLRMESSDITIESANANFGLGSNNRKKYTDWFPSATLNYYLDDAEKNQIQVSYSRRIERPRGWWLTPFMSRSDDRNVFQGNPDLDPVISQNYELSYLTQINKTSITPSIYYKKNTDDMTVLRRLTELDGQSVFLSMPVNAGDEERYGAELVASTQFTSWWRAFGNLNLFGYKKTGAYVDPQTNIVYDLSGDGFSWFARLSNNITLPSKINMQVNGNYSAGQENALSKRDGMWSVDLALSKDILKGNGTISFNVRDLFDSRKMDVHSFGTNFDSYSMMQWRPRSFTLNFTYRINQSNKRDRRNNNNNNSEDFEEGMEF